MPDYKEVLKTLENMGYEYIGGTLEDKNENLVGLFDINFNEIQLNAMDKDGNWQTINIKDPNWAQNFKNWVETDPIEHKANESLKLDIVKKIISR